MTKKNITVYRDDILSAIEKIHQYTVDGEDAFIKNEIVQDAVLRQLSIIGEAASRLPEEIRQQYDELPWKQIIGMRNVIIHEYSDVNISRVWDTIQTDLPTLKQSVQNMS